jgi:hypothetical protein
MEGELYVYNNWDCLSTLDWPGSIIISRPVAKNSPEWHLLPKPLRRPP